MICPKCASEYVEGIVTCSDCDVALVSEMPAPPPKPSYRDMTVVASFADRVSAAAAASFLESEGIPSLVRSEDTGGIRPELAFSSGVYVLAPAGEAEHARELLDAFNLTGEPADRDS